MGSLDIRPREERGALAGHLAGRFGLALQMRRAYWGSIGAVSGQVCN